MMRFTEGIGNNIVSIDICQGHISRNWSYKNSNYIISNKGGLT